VATDNQVEGCASLYIRRMVRDDAAAVSAIYAEGIATGDATFETAPPDWALFDADHLHLHRLVAIQKSEVCGWAALSPVSDRCAYRGVAEDSVYVAAAHRGAGIGRALLRSLLTGADSAGIWTVQAGIFPENVSSVRLHQELGFRVVGIRERIGCLNGRWRDVLLLERRKP
jgi:phosphinothricin acetyltransferase